MKFEWEQIFHKDIDHLVVNTSRAKVEGGWVILNKTLISNSESMVFISDPEHLWKID